VTETFKNHSTFSTISGPVAQPGASESALSERAIRALVLYDYVLNKNSLGEPEVLGSKVRDCTLNVLAYGWTFLAMLGSPTGHVDVISD